MSPGDRIYLQLSRGFPQSLHEKAELEPYVKFRVFWDVAPCSHIDVDDGGSTHL
jgi:hypothetical protein